MAESKLRKFEGDWHQRVQKLKAKLEKVTSELIELEAALADQLAAINAFEFTLRARVNPLVNRLEGLEKEIKGFLRQLHRVVPEDIDEDWGEWSVDEEGAAGGGEFRYWQKAAPAAASSLDDDQQDELKRMYRQLARRFHPDLGVDAADRAYRTQLMMAINAAYAAGDMDKLLELALEPDSADLMDFAQTDEQLARALEVEIKRCRRRILEIDGELRALDMHASSRLMRQVKRAERQGRDLLAEMIDQLKEEIAVKMVERDALRGELTAAGGPAAGIRGDAFADVVWDISLEHAYEEGDETGFAEWVLNQRGALPWDDDILDDTE